MSLWEGGNLTTVYNYIRIGAFLPINPSATTLCVCHSGFLIVSEYFPDDWCINQQKFPQIVHAVKYRTFWCLYVSNLDLLACWTTLNIAFTVSPSILTLTCFICTNNYNNYCFPSAFDLDFRATANECDCCVFTWEFLGSISTDFNFLPNE